MTLDKQIPEGQFFKVDGGPALPSVLALRAYLRMIPAGQFAKHVGADRNDFAAWVEHVFEERELAARLRQCRSREQMVWALDDAFSDIRMAKVLAQRDGEQAGLTPVSAGMPGNADPVALTEDETFNAPKADIVVTNERISKKYEEVAKQMQDAMSNPMPKELEQLCEKLKSRYADLMAKISETRKSGKDTLIPSLVMRSFMPKLALANATRERKDYDLAAVVLDEAEAELKIVQQTEEPDLRKEVLRLAGIETKAKE